MNLSFRLFPSACQREISKIHERNISFKPIPAENLPTRGVSTHRESAGVQKARYIEPVNSLERHWKWCNMKHELTIKTECERREKIEKSEQMNKKRNGKCCSFGYKINIVHNAPE